MFIVAPDQREAADGRAEALVERDPEIQREQQQETDIEQRTGKDDRQVAGREPG